MDLTKGIVALTKDINLTKLSKTELLKKCEELEITKCKSKNKEQLIEYYSNQQYLKKYASI